MVTITRHWDMPNANTFLIPTIADILREFVGDGVGWLDPFANGNSPAKITNDLNPEMPTNYHLDAVEFLKLFDNDTQAGVLLDPPYSFHQIVEMYDGYGGKRLKAIAAVYNEAARVVKPGGLVLSFGWNSNGVGKNRKFKTERVYLIAHGGSHNDTIVTVQRKTATQLAFTFTPNKQIVPNC